MLSLDLFDSKYERELREGAVDDLEYRRMNDLREKMEYLMQAYKKADTDEVKNAIMKRYNEYKAEREGYLKIREQQVPSRQDPFAYVKPEPKGIGDTQDPKQKMAQLAQRSKKGAMANVAAGIKAFIKGEPEPMGEEQQLGRRGIGMTNIKNLGLTASKGLAGTIFQFPNMRYLVNEDDSDKMVDYYNALDSAGRTNFVYNVLGDGMKFLEMCKSLGIKPTPVEQQQPELPGIQVDPQGQLPLSEKKKSSNDDLEAGDVKVARELQKLRAQYPAAKSDVEAVARAEIDSTERSQQQLAAIRGANEKQDALLKQLVALDQEQGREISGLDKENNSLEQRLAQVQATNDRLQQAVGTMVGAKKAASKTQKTVPQGSADLAQGGIIDVGGPVAGKDTSTSVDQPSPGQTVPGNLSKAPGLDPITKADEFEPIQKKVSNMREHGGGIGPRQHWQDLMQEGQPQELINRYLAIDAENDVEAVRAAIQAISKDPALSVTSKSRLLGQIGMIIRRHRLPLGRAYYQFMRQYMEEQTVSETVENVRAGMAKIYRRLAPKIERHRDSFLAGQLYDELENYAELHGAEGEFKRMMATARNSAHMEYDTNPGGFQNWFWFLPFEDDMEEGTKSQLAGAALAGAMALGPGSAGARVTGGEDPGVNRLTGKPNVTQAVSGDQVKPSAPAGYNKEYLQSVVDGTHPRPMVSKEKAQALLNQLKEQGVAEGWSDQGNPTAFSVYIDGREWRAYKSDEQARRVAEKVQANLKLQGRDQTVTIAPSRTKRVQEDFGMPGTTIPRKSVIQGYTVFFNPKTQVVSVTRGGDSEEAAIEQARVGTPSMKNFRQAADRLIDKIESDLTENITREPRTARERDEMIDKIRRMMTQDRNPANLQIMKKDIEILQTKYRDLKEDSDSGEAVEMAIMRRMLVAHTDLIIEFGLDKVVAAIEEVAYDVGDVDEIGSSDVSGWVHQVERILGVEA